MLSSFLLVAFAGLQATFSTIITPNAIFRLSLKTSHNTTSLSNYNLGAWPSRWWSFRVNKDVVIQFIRYGREAPRSEWKMIRQDFYYISREINTEPKPGQLNQYLWRNVHRGTHTLVRFFDTTNPQTFWGTPSISRKDALDVLHAVQRMFFTLRENPLDPRELKILIKIRRTHPPTTSNVTLSIDWLDEKPPLHWPQPLPSLQYLPYFREDRELPMMVKYLWYGRDVGDSSRDLSLYDVLGWFIDEIEAEGSSADAVNKATYYQASARLTIYRLENHRITRAFMVAVVNLIRYTIYTRRWGPREFEAGYSMGSAGPEVLGARVRFWFQYP